MAVVFATARPRSSIGRADKSCSRPRYPSKRCINRRSSSPRPVSGAVLLNGRSFLLHGICMFREPPSFHRYFIDESGWRQVAGIFSRCLFCPTGLPIGTRAIYFQVPVFWHLATLLASFEPRSITSIITLSPGTRFPINYVRQSLVQFRLWHAVCTGSVRAHCLKHPLSVRYRSFHPLFC